MNLVIESYFFICIQHSFMNLMNESIGIDKITLTIDAYNGVDDGVVDVAPTTKKERVLVKQLFV